MEKLKPCPVCGNHQLSFVTGVMTSRTCVLCEECGEESNWYNTKNEAVEDWNRRVEMDKQKSNNGHWIVCSDEKINIICSKCAYNVDFKEGDLPRFCPKCNAVMVGDANGTDK